VVKGEMTPGEFSSFLTLSLCSMPRSEPEQDELEIQEGLAAATRVYELLDTTLTSRKNPVLCCSSHFNGVDFRNVTFKYDEDWSQRHTPCEMGEVMRLVE